MEQEKIQPLVSVIVPVYNVEPYLEQCVDSIRHQTMTEIEILLIDDGSLDRCPQMCDQFAAEDKRIRVFHQANKGVSAARNLGMVMAVGEWLMFVDSDDWLEKCALSVLYQKAVETQCDVVCASFYRNYLDKQVSAWLEGIGEKIYLTRENQQFLFECAAHRVKPKKEAWLRGPCWKLYHTKSLRVHQITFPVEYKLSEDMIFNVHVIYHAKKIYLAEIPIYHYRMRRRSVSHMISSEEREQRVKSYIAIRNFIENCQGTKELLPYYYYCVVMELIDFTLARGENVHNIHTFYMVVRELKKFANQPECREAIENINVKMLSSLDKGKQKTNNIMGCQPYAKHRFR